MSTPPRDPGALPPIPPNVLSIKQKYAWDWFNYHATQRMTALNYFFVTMGILAVAYSKCVENGWRGIGCLVGGLGAMASVAFWFLDVRNEELVNCGREALRQFEEKFGASVRQDDFDRKYLLVSTGCLSGRILEGLSKILPKSRRERGLGESGRYQFWAGDVFAHRFWIRAIQFFAFVAFFGGAVFAWIGYPHCFLR